MALFARPTACDAVIAASDRLTLFLEIRQNEPRPDNAMLFHGAVLRFLG